ncbi:hypothetical protein [Corynebacterium lactis]|uniref:Uncharacterized protein n=1 Tax=Corynebacterium lactis RW2-5 TaxID=1408189 RepID=A0A0K2H426_9CORY|nr:hypothetical protein [Corynebacterium lactis]ALA68708.1 hypothetical protein CLAC_11185 [Corynebacterium lactis RW2-5]
MIPFVFILAAGLIVVAIVLLIVDRRSRKQSSAVHPADGISNSSSNTSEHLAAHAHQSESDNSLNEESADANTDSARELGKGGSSNTADHEHNLDGDEKFLEGADQDGLQADGSEEPNDAALSIEVTEPGVTGGATNNNPVEGASSPSGFGEQEVAQDSGDSANAGQPDSAATEASEARDGASVEPEAQNGPKETEASGLTETPQAESHSRDEGESADSTENADSGHESAGGGQPVAASASAPRKEEHSRRPLRGRRLRQQRKAWAVARNATFARTDRELPSYWRRTPGGDAKAVVSGFSHGREMHLADISGVTFLALRRTVASDEVFELRRSGETSLPHVATEAGLKVAATTPELIHRVFDDRANRMLAELDPVIERIWSENEWSLAQLVPGADSEEWDRALESLAAFSDIARRLPPAEGETYSLETGQWDPTRLQLTAAAVDENQRASGLHGGRLQVVPEGKSGAPTSSSPGSADFSSADEEPLEVVDVLDVEELDGIGDEPGAGADEEGSNRAGPKEQEFQTIDKSSWRPVRESSLKSEELPTRLTARRMGVSDVGMPADMRAHSEDIPALGEDPDHSQLKERGGSIVRSNARPASIFKDYSESDSPAPATSVASEDSEVPDSAEKSKGEATSSAQDKD